MLLHSLLKFKIPQQLWTKTNVWPKPRLAAKHFQHSHIHQGTVFVLCNLPNDTELDSKRGNALLKQSRVYRALPCSGLF